MEYLIVSESRRRSFPHYNRLWCPIGEQADKRTAAEACATCAKLHICHQVSVESVARVNGTYRFRREGRKRTIAEALVADGERAATGISYGSKARTVVECVLNDARKVDGKRKRGERNTSVKCFSPDGR